MAVYDAESPWSREDDFLVSIVEEFAPISPVLRFGLPTSSTSDAVQGAWGRRTRRKGMRSRVLIRPLHHSISHAPGLDPAPLTGWRERRLSCHRTCSMLR